MLGQRFYDPGVSRFLTRDPLDVEGGLNLYRYADNNPVNIADPTGECPMCVTGAIGLVGGAIVGGGIAWYNGGSTHDILVGAGKGAVIGGVAGLTGGLAGGAAASIFGGSIIGGIGAGAVGGAVGDAAGQGVELALGWRCSFSWAEVGMSAALGGVLNGAGRAFKARFPCGLCFAADTLVQMADGSTKPISQVQVGDLVKSRDPATGRDEVKTVTGTIERHAPSVVDVALHNAKTGQSETLTCTPEHPFYVEGQGWVEAGSLGIGTSIVTRAGPQMAVTQVTWQKNKAEELASGTGSPFGGYTVYNLTVDGDHTFFVGTTGGGTWVHNESPCEGLGNIKSLFGKSEKQIMRSKPSSWVRSPADSGSGWKLTDGSGRERVRFMRPIDDTDPQWSRQRVGYWRWQNAADEFLDENGNVVPRSNPDFQFLTHIPYSGAD